MDLRRLLPAAFVLLLLIGTLATAATAIHREERIADEQGRAGAARVADVTRIGVANAAAALSGTAGLFDASTLVTPADFDAYARRILAHRAMAGLGWLERVPARGRAGFEARTGTPIVEPVGTVRTRVAPARAEHFPLVYYSSDVIDRVIGTDASYEPRRRAAMARAVALDAPVATPPVQLVGGGGRAVILYQPVFAGGVAPAGLPARRRALRGYIVGWFLVESLAARIIVAADPGVPVEIRDGGALISRPLRAADAVRTDIDVVGRRWTIRAGRPEPSRAGPLMILLGGAALTLLALLLAVIVARRGRFAVAAVDRAMAHLHAGERRYRVLVETLSDGVVVQDASGAITSCNPAAEAILGSPDAETAETSPVDVRWRGVREDGSPLPTGQHPATITLGTGTPTDDVVMGVHRTDGSLAWLSVSTRLLDEDDGRAVVCCFTDITERVQAAREQAALRRVATFVAGDAEPAAVHRLVAREAAALTGAEAAGVVRFDEHEVRGTVVGVHAPERRTAQAGARVDLTGAVADVARDGAIARRDHAGPAGDAILPEVPVRSAVAAPIRVGNRLWGAITTASTRDGAPLAPDTGERLSRLGELVALAVMSSEARAQLATLAATDHLTSLPNRRAFTDRLASEIERARRDDTDVSLVLIDVDHFKRINDTYGHPAGDRVLMGIGAELSAGVRAVETVARIGGEEFGWILPGTGGRSAVKAAERLREHLGSVTFDGVGTITLSMGVSDLRDASGAAELLRLADAALYRAKQGGRDRIVRHEAALQPAVAGAPETVG